MIASRHPLPQSDSHATHSTHARQATRIARAMRAVRIAIALGVAAAAAACSSLPPAGPQPVSVALADTADTALARTVQRSTPATAAANGLSGFRLLADGEHAFEARLALIRSAEKSIDVQYYLIAEDEAGQRFVAALAVAAARGVRVRLLVDDLYTRSGSGPLAVLARQANVELRVFNPLPARDGSVPLRMLLSLHEFDRVERRMHNKLLIADGSVAITGGRNIADEYFKRSATAGFIDMDVLAAGPVLVQLSALFDRFWNSRAVRLAGSLGSARPDTAAIATPPERRDRPVRTADRFEQGPVGVQLEAGRLDLVFAPAELIADEPGKAEGHQAEQGLAMTRAVDVLRSARSEVLLASPYFIPCEQGIAAIREAKAAGIRMVVVTNAFTGTDEPLVHWAYARYRSELLRLGVELHELSPTVGRRAVESAHGGSGSSLGRLHAKLSVIDRRRVLIGSMNLDGRSMHSNTEISLLIDSPALAAQVAESLRNDREESGYRLRAGADGRAIEWVSGQDGHAHVDRSEPGLDWRSRLKLGFLSLFVAEELL